MSILKFKREPAIHLAGIVEEIKDYKKKKAQAEHEIEKLEAHLESHINEDRELYEGGVYLGKFPFGTWSGLLGKLLKEERPEIHAEYYITKPSKASWKFA